MFEYYFDRDENKILGLTGINDDTHYIAECGTDLEIKTTEDSCRYGKHGNHFIISNERRINRTGVVSLDGTEIVLWSKLPNASCYKISKVI